MLSGLWEARAQGLFLVINLWAGVGSLLVALVCSECRCIALTVEPNRSAAQCHATAFPQAALMERDIQGVSCILGHLRAKMT